MSTKTMVFVLAVAALVAGVALILTGHREDAYTFALPVLTGASGFLYGHKRGRRNG